MASLKQLWRESLLFRRITTISAFVLAALLVELASHYPRAVSPSDLDEKGTFQAKIGEKIVIKNPNIAPGHVVLSYVGSKNEVADIWLESATLDDRSQHLLFPHSDVSVPARIGYTTSGDPSRTKSGETCHTTIEITRGKDFIPFDTLAVFQTDDMAGAQRFRQVVLDAGESTMEIEVHTESPTDEETHDLLNCHKLLTIGDRAPIEPPAIPLRMFVHRGTINLHFNPANPQQSIFTGREGREGREETFEAVSLGENTLQGSRLQVVAKERSIPALLDVQPSSANSITLSHLEVAADKLYVSIGPDTESFKVYANGSSRYYYNYIDLFQKNPVSSWALATMLGSILGAWVKKICFPTNLDSSPNS